MSNQTYCIHCGAEIKKKRIFGKCECFSCRSAKEYLKKGAHASSIKQVKGLKKLDEQGTDFAARLFVKNH